VVIAGLLFSRWLAGPPGPVMHSGHAVAVPRDY
jgi:hypothetical protein